MMQFVMVCRLDTQENWSIVSNPKWSTFPEDLATQILLKTFSEYVEYKSCGVVSRVIYKKDLAKYIEITDKADP